MKIKSFIELNKVLNQTPFSQYKELDREGREVFLLKHGIRTDKEYIGKYNKYKNTVTINELTNPFTDKVLTVEFLEDRELLKHGDLVGIRIILATTEGQYLTEDNILFCERFGYKEERRKIILQREKERELEKKRQEEEQRRKEEEERRKAEERAKERLRERIRIRREAEEHAREHARERIEQKLQLLQLLNERRICHLVHFTQLENLDSILERGILPRTETDNSDIDCLINDVVRYDKCEDCSCFSLEYPNTYLLNTYRKNSKNAKWVMFFLNADLLTEHLNFYADYNAASNGVRHALRQRNTINDFEAMFCDELHVNPYSGPKHFTREMIRDYPYLPTSDQAEILVRGIVGIDKIQIIYFQSDEDRRQFENDKRCEGIELLVHPLIFEKHREDYGLFTKR